LPGRKKSFLAHHVCKVYSTETGLVGNAIEISAKAVNLRVASAPLQRAFVGLTTTLCRALLDARLSTNSPYLNGIARTGYLTNDKDGEPCYTPKNRGTPIVEKLKRSYA
jgi:hypothetical protein